MFRGTTVFELQNVKTGAVERFVDQNMFTGALNELYNKKPFGMLDELFGADYNSAAARWPAMNPVFSTALGGLLLFPQALEEDASRIFAPANNKPVGIASVLNNPNTDPRRGSFNAIESGEFSNGYRFVYDFSTSQANGQIASVALTSKWGGATYLDDLRNFICEGSQRVSVDQAPFGFARYIVNPDYSGRFKIIAADESGIYFLRSDYKTIDKLNIKAHSLSLVGNYNTSSLLGVADTAGYVFATQNEICFMRTAGNSSGNATVTIDKYSKVNFSKTTQVITVAAPLAATKNGHTIAYDPVIDCLYMVGRTESKIYRVNLSNPADVIEITAPVSSSELFGCSPFVVGSNFIIEQDGSVHSSATTVGNACSALVGVYVLGCAKNWTSASYADNRATSCNPVAPYLATVNNLSNVVSKTSDKTMKVTYTVTNG